MADIRVRVGQPDLHVNVGQQGAIKVLASNTALVGGISTYALKTDFATIAGIATFATKSGIATSVIGGIASVSHLYVSGISTFVGITTFTGDVYFSGNIIGNLTSIDGGSF
jgi:hypothetical protein